MKLEKNNFLESSMWHSDWYIKRIPKYLMKKAEKC